MMSAMQFVVIVWQSLVVRLSVVIAFPDAGHAANPDRAKANDVCRTEIEDIVGDPSAVVQLEEIIARLVIAATEEGQEGSNSLTAVVLVEIANFLVFSWHRDAGCIE